MKEKLNELTALVNDIAVTVEVVGDWIWLSGETKPIKEQLKLAGCRWSAQRSKWYWHEGGYRKRSKNVLHFEEMKEIFGHQTIKAQQ